MLFYLGLGCFFGAHSVGLVPPLRGALQHALTERGYLGLYTLLSAVGMVLIFLGYDSQTVVRWAIVLPALRDFSPWIMFLAFWLLIAANLPCWTRRWVRHPMTAGIAIWSLCHLALNPDLHSWWLFGAFLVFVFLSASTVSYRGKSIAVFVPNLKFDLLAFVVSAALTLTMYYFHGQLFGVAIR
ncbi:MAG: NnrU family protein [Pseudomonadales bacterium]